CRPSSHRPQTPFDLLFFFSSIRRHTISDRDWSSDVCSSDLTGSSSSSFRGRGPPGERARPPMQPSVRASSGPRGALRAGVRKIFDLRAPPRARPVGDPTPEETRARRRRERRVRREGAPCSSRVLEPPRVLFAEVPADSAHTLGRFSRSLLLLTVGRGAPPLNSVNPQKRTGNHLPRGSGILPGGGRTTE